MESTDTTPRKIPMAGGVGYFRITVVPIGWGIGGWGWVARAHSHARRTLAHTRAQTRTNARKDARTHARTHAHTPWLTKAADEACDNDGEAYRKPKAAAGSAVTTRRHGPPSYNGPNVEHDAS